jgi:WD40 repeat protein/tRNA A-37 threonylcarbamoyl transferase component Bud32
MTEPSSLDDLVSRWQHLRQQGETLSPEELCADCPERVAELRERLRELDTHVRSLPDSNGGPPATPVAHAPPTVAPPGANDRLTSTSPPLAMVPGYEVLEVLGKGGMGIVYKARHLRLNRIVALKMLLRAEHALEEERRRFQGEAEAVARLQHPNIVQIHEIGEHNGCPFFSLELCSGGSLAKQLAANLPDAKATAALVIKLAEAAHAAHQAQVIHRDLKPANVLLTEQGEPKITDFGLAKRLGGQDRTQTGAVMGTPSYMSPEQAGNTKDVGPAVDVYALGAILYECLTGRPPFRGTDILDTLEEVRTADPMPPSRLQRKVPRDLEVICLKCLQKAPTRRYATAQDLADDLRRFLAGEPIQARPISMSERAWRWARRYPVVAGLLAAVTLSVLAGLGGVLHFAFRGDLARIDAEKARTEAQASADALRRGLVRQHIVLGSQFLEGDDRSHALWEFAEAWRLDVGGDEAAHRERLGFTLQTGPQLVSVGFHRRPVLDTLFSPDGKTILTRTDEPSVYLWSALTGKQVLAPLLHSATVTAAVFTPDGQHIVTGSEDGNVRLWQADTGKLLRTLEQPAAVRALALHGDLLAVAAPKGKVLFWHLTEGHRASVNLELPAAVYHVAFSPDGTKLVTADIANTARVWEVATGRPLTDPLPHRDHRAEKEMGINYRRWPVFAPNGSTVVTVSDLSRRPGTVTAWDLTTGKERWPPWKGNYVHQVGFSPDGTSLVVADGSSVMVFDAATGRWKGALHHPRESQHFCFSPDSKVLATCSTGGLVHVWDFLKGQKLAQPVRCADGVHALAFSADSQLLVAASHDGTARTWRVAGRSAGRPLVLSEGRPDRITFTNGADQARYSPSGDREVRYGGERVRLFNADLSGETQVDHRGAVILARFQPDGRRALLMDARFRVGLFDAQTGRQSSPWLALARPLAGLGFSSDGGRLLTVETADTDHGAGPVVTVWDVATGKALLGPLRRWDAGPQNFGDPSMAGQISRAALSPTGEHVVLASDATGTLAVRKVDTGEEVARARGFRGLMYQVRFSQDGRHFLTNGSDTVARLWRTATCEPAGPPLHHHNFCRQADLAPDGVHVVTAASDQVIRLWDGVTGDLLGRIDGWPEPQNNGVWFSRDGRAVVVFSGKEWRMLDLPAYRGSLSDLPALLALLTGLERASDGSIGPIDERTFLQGPEAYRRAWEDWIGKGHANEGHHEP